MTREELEKEAEGKYCKGCKWRIEQCLWAWRKTNGLKEPNEKNCSCKEVPAYIAGAEFGYNKANEWHYVKDRKYPKEKQLVMVYRINPLGANIAITNWYDSYKDTKVIAWKEIVLPELKESE